MSRKKSNALLTKPLIIIMVLSLALPIATFFLKYMKTKERYNVLDMKYQKRQKEFDDTVLRKIGAVDKIQRKRIRYDKVNKTLKSRQCTTPEIANELLNKFAKNISPGASNRGDFRISTSMMDLDRSKLPGYDTVLRLRVYGKATLMDFWRIMSQITQIGYSAFYCPNKSCPLYEVSKKQEEIENVKNCPECGTLLKKGVLAKFYYIEKFVLDTRYFNVKTGKELDIDIIIAIPISKRGEN